MTKTKSKPFTLWTKKYKVSTKLAINATDHWWLYCKNTFVGSFNESIFFVALLPPIKGRYHGKAYTSPNTRQYAVKRHD